jgi:hypothetical protein
MMLTAIMDSLGDGKIILAALDRVQTPHDLSQQLQMEEARVIDALQELQLLKLVECTANARKYGRTKKGEEVYHGLQRKREEKT